MTQRVWGRVYADDGTYQWVPVVTDIYGYNDAVNCTWFAQALKLNIGESPFYSQYGLPAYQSVASQVPPNYYVAQMQSLFSAYFPSLIISKNLATPAAPTPTYGVQIVTTQGSAVFFSVPA